MATPITNSPRRPRSRKPTAAQAAGIVAVASPPPDADLAGQQTGSSAGPALAFSGGGFPNLFGWASGGTWDNPLAFEGYGRPFLATLETWRLMLRHPVIHAAWAAVCDPVRTSSWNYEAARDDIPPTLLKKMIADVKRDFDPLRRDFVNVAIRGRNFGHAGAELVWATEGGYRLKKIVAQPVLATVYQTDTGDFAGLGVTLRAGVAGSASLTVGSGLPGLPAPFKSWLYCHEPTPELPLLGTSWLEAARDAWRDWLDAAQQLQKLVAKISGMLLVVRCPTGNMPGETTTYEVAITGQLEVVGKQGGYALVLPGVPVPLMANGKGVDYGKVAEMGTYQPIAFESIDFGTNSPAIASVLARMEHDESLMVMAAGRSARTLTEGAAGTHAETASKLDAATTASELLNDDIAHQGQAALDAKLVLCYGERYRGAIRITCPPLDTTKANARASVVSGVFAIQNTDAQVIMLRKLGNGFFEQYFSDCGATYNADFNLDDAFESIALPSASPPPAGAEPLDAEPPEPAAEPREPAEAAK